MAGGAKKGGDVKNLPRSFHGTFDIGSPGDVPLDDLDSVCEKGLGIRVGAHQGTHRIPETPQPPGEVSPGESAGSRDEDSARP